MSNHVNETSDQKPIKKRSKMARWYSFNKHKIPLYLSLISVILFSATLDFDLGGFELKSHLYTVVALGTTFSALAVFSVFVITLLSMIQIVNTFSFGQKKNPMSLFLMTGITVLQTVAVVFYTYVVMTEPSRSNGFTFEKFPYAIFSYSVYIAGLVVQLIATTLAWIYVDWKYVKIED